MIAVNHDMRGIDSHFLIVVIKLLTVRIRAKLCREDALRSKSCKSDSAVCSLATGKIGNACVIDESLACLGELIHIHRKLHICASDEKNSFFVTHVNSNLEKSWIVFRGIFR